MLILSKSWYLANPSILAIQAGNLAYTTTQLLPPYTHTRDSVEDYFATTTTIFPFALPVFNFA